MIPNIEVELERRRKISETMKGRMPKNFDLFISKAGTFDKSKNSSLFKSGEKHPNWKGDGASYNALHQWIRNRIKRPEGCVKCKTKTDRLEISNTSGEYKRDLNDWRWLCISCHRKYDYWRRRNGS